MTAVFFSSVCDSALFNWFVLIVWCVEMIKSSNRTLLICFPYFLLSFIEEMLEVGWVINANDPSVLLLLTHWLVLIVECVDLIKANIRTQLFCFPYLFVSFYGGDVGWGWSMQTTHPSSSCSHNRNDSSSSKQGQSDPADYFWLSLFLLVISDYRHHYKYHFWFLQNRVNQKLLIISSKSCVAFS